MKQYVSPIKSNLYTMNKSFDAKIVFSQKIMFILHYYRRFNLFCIVSFSKHKMDYSCGNYFTIQNKSLLNKKL